MAQLSEDLREAACGFVVELRRQRSLEYVLERYRKALVPFQEADGRSLVDGVLPEVVSALCEALRVVMLLEERRGDAEHVGHAIVGLVAARGWKQVAGQMPHEASDFGDVFLALNGSERIAWQVRYSLFLWMSTLVLLPFDLQTVDATEGKDLADNLVRIGLEALNDKGKVRDGAVALLVKLLNRRDMTSHLSGFLDVIRNLNPNSSSVSFRLGCLSCLAGIFKHGDRKELKSQGLSMLPWLSQTQSTLLESTAEQLLLTKVAQRLAMVLVPPSPAKWLYRSSVRGLFGEGTDQAPPTAENDSPLTENVLLCVEEVLEKLLCGLKARDTVIRWSAAKGIGRITGRMPFILARDIVEAVLKLFYTSQEGEPNADSTFHGVCLCLAELARRGLLLPSSGHLDAAVAIVTHCLRFDQRRGAHSVGSNVRDAACYTVWAFARAYSRADMRQHAHPLATAILPVILLDREINCRRAASAAFQECVGRLEEKTFPGGIEIVTRADFFAVSDRIHSYLVLSPIVSSIAKGFYAQCLIDELVEFKSAHWDQTIREISATALAKILKSTDPHADIDGIVSSLAGRTIDKFDAASRHGALVGLSEIVRSLSLSSEAKERVTAIPSSLIKNKLLVGESGEITSAGCAMLIDAMCLAGWISVHSMQPCLDILMTLLNSEADHLQSRAVAAFGSLYQCSIADSTEDREFVVERIRNRMQSSKGARTGYIRVAAFLEKHATALSKQLCSMVEGGTDVCSPEERREAVRTLCQLDGTGNYCWRAYVAALKNYEVDNRGDVGSWSRAAAMECAGRSLSICPPDIGYAKELTGLVVTQICERIERLRLLAAKCLSLILSVFPNSFVNQVRETISNEEITVPRVFFPKVVGFLGAEGVRSYALAGLISSAGRNEGHSGEAQKALNSFAERMDQDFLGEHLVNVLEGKLYGERLVTPCLRVLEAFFHARLLEPHLARQKMWLEVMGRLVRGHATRAPLEMERVAPLVACMSFLTGVGNAGEASVRALEGFMFLLGHQRPRVREAAAQELYMRLLESEPHIFGSHKSGANQALNLLLDQPWSSGNRTELRLVRDQLCKLLKVDPPKRRTP